MRTRLALCVVAVALSANTLMAAAPAAGERKALTIEQILSTTAHDQLLALAISKTEEIALLLRSAEDRESAAKVAPSLERAYLELGLIAERTTMLSPPPASERGRFAEGMTRFIAAQDRLQQECTRLAALPAAHERLLSVLQPLHAQLKGQSIARERSANSMMQTVRSQVELYKLQHQDRVPDFRKQGWAQLTGRTDEKGNVSADGKYGPYLAQSPVNPLTGSSVILVGQGRIKPGFRYPEKDAGFVYEESTGRIWALDAGGRLLGENTSANAAGW